MNKSNMLAIQVCVLSGLCLCVNNAFAMEKFFRDHEETVRWCGITGGVTLAGSLFFSHVIVPIASGHRKQAELERRAQEHTQEQDRLRGVYHEIEGKYNAATVPSNVQTLYTYKRNLAGDIAELNRMLSFAWDSSNEKEVIMKLAHHLSGLENQVERFITARTVQDIKKEYRRELELIGAGNTVVPQTMNSIVFEKYGNMHYKFGSYKSDLAEKIAQCKQLNATEEEMQELDLLDKLTNSLFSQSLDTERVAREKAQQAQRLFDAEIDSKMAVKDFYKEAQHHVTTASNTVARFAHEMDTQCKQQMSIIEKCSFLLNALSTSLSNWAIRSEQQTERIVYEVRQEGQMTCATVHGESQAIQAKIRQVGKKADVAVDVANQAQQQASQAQHAANAALAPMPPATNPYVNDDNRPSAPPMDE